MQDRHQIGELRHPINSLSLIYNISFRLSEEEKLFEAVEDGRVKGLNTSLLASIIAMYLKKGVPRDNPTPYLSPEKVQ